MKNRNLFKTYILSWDFLLAASFAGLSAILFARMITNTLAKDIYGIGISVLSIIFSVYFAALAIIMSSSDDEFVRFLEEIGDYSHLIETFKYTLGMLFASLMYSIIMYVVTSTMINDLQQTQSKWLLVVFSFLFPYSLFVTANTTLDSIKYAKARAEFLAIVRRKK